MNNFVILNENDIATIAINRPEVLNAMNAECWSELSDILDMIESSEKIKAAIFTGSGEKAFIAGADINFLKTRTSINALEGLAQKTLIKLNGCSKPTIAAINGIAFGAGCEFAIACDIRITAQNGTFAFPEVGLGILPGAGGTQRLSRLVGIGNAMDMILTGKRVAAMEAKEMGLVSRIVPVGEAVVEACKVAKTIIAKGPIAVRLAKQAVYASTSSDINTGLMLELLSYSVLVSSEDKDEGVHAFLEKRKPEFHGK